MVIHVNAAGGWAGEELDLVPETVDAVRVLMENPPYGRYAVHT
jgi:hypothetical protein